MKKKVMLTVIAIVAIAAATANAELTAYYDFEPDSPLDDRGGAFADNLTGYNAAWSSDVPPTGSTQSASFDGDTALFTDAYSSDLGPDPSAYTVMFWVKGRDEDQENNNTRLITTRKRPDGSDAANPAWQVEGFGNDGTRGTRMDLRANNGTSNLVTDDAKSGSIGALANTGQETVWHHVAFVVANTGHPDDAGAYTETFFDGVSVGVVNLDPSWDGINIANPDGQLIIGGNSENAGTRAFSGLLDDVALFSGIVSAEDIAAIAAGTISDLTRINDYLMKPFPDHGDTVYAGDVELSWTNLSSETPDSNDVYVDVWFGTEPNELHPASDMTLVVDATNGDDGKNTESVMVDASAVDTYYWQVNWYLNGADNINEPNMFEGPLWTFTTRPDLPIESVDAGEDMITWSGQVVQLDATVVDDGVSPLTYLWTADDDSLADANLTIEITNDDQEDATVKITKTAPTGDATVVTMTLAGNNVDSGKPAVEDTMTIDVYDDFCKAAEGAGTLEFDPTDFDANCITNLEDFAELAAAWLDYYTLAAPVEKP